VKTAPALLLFGSLLALCALSGCAAAPATLTVRSTQHRAAYAQTFRQAYAGRTDDGTYEFLLVADDAARATAQTKPGQPLEPVAQTPLRQVVYLKVLWRPIGGTDSGAANNATLDWYVFSDAPSARGDLLQYRGTAFVSVTPRDQKTRVTVRDGTIMPRAARGGLSDPIGVARLSGSFTAVANDARLEALLAATRARVTDTPHG
jgi:hypothetical protein